MAQQSSHRKTWPPRATVRQRSMARHHLQLVEAYVASIGVTPRRPVIAEDIRDLQDWTGHGR